MERIINEVAERLKELGYTKDEAHKTAVILWIFTEKDKRGRLGYMTTSPILVTKTAKVKV